MRAGEKKTQRIRHRATKNLVFECVVVYFFHPVRLPFQAGRLGRKSCYEQCFRLFYFLSLHGHLLMREEQPNQRVHQRRIRLAHLFLKSIPEIRYFCRTDHFWSQHMIFQNPRHKFRPRTQIEFGVNVLEMCFDRQYAQYHFVCDFVIPFSLRDETRDLPFAFG